MKKNMTLTRFSIWLAGVSFVLFQFFLQLSSGVLISTIVSEMNLSAFMAGLLGSSMYIVYTALQIPVGIFFDRKNTRNLLALNAFICSLGCFLFAASYHLPGLFIGRFLIGGGAAFAFVGFSHVLRQYFPLKQFAFMIGLSETLSFIITVFGIIGLGKLFSHTSWHLFVNFLGFIGCSIAIACWLIIPNHTPAPLSSISYSRQILDIVRNKTAWLNGLFVGLCFTLVTVFGALWAIPFIRVKLHCTLFEASILDALFFLGTGASCPLFGFLSMRFKHRVPLMFLSCLSTLVLLLSVLYLPITQPILLGALLFMTGACCGAYMLGYTIANEIAPEHSLSTSTGFTNTLALLTAPILQPMIGYLLDLFRQYGFHELIAYQSALSILPIGLAIAAVIVLYLPEKKSQSIDHLDSTCKEPSATPGFADSSIKRYSVS